MAKESKLEKSIKTLLRNGAKDWQKHLVTKAKGYAPNHIAPFVTSKLQITDKVISITLSVKRVDAYRKRSQYARAYGGAVAGQGGTLDAAAQEYGSGLRSDNEANKPQEMITIVPRKRTGGNNARKYGNLAKKTNIKAFTYQRGWLAMPNFYNSMVARGAWQGTFRPSISKDGNTMFVKKVEHPGIDKYRGRGYLRISIRSTMDYITKNLPVKMDEMVRKNIKASLKEGVLSRTGKTIIIK
jgi:hypothetical protein